MGEMVSPITSLTIVYSIVYSEEIIKAPPHWPLCGEFTGDRWIPRTNGQWRENVSIWWRHHDEMKAQISLVHSFLIYIYLYIRICMSMYVWQTHMYMESILFMDSCLWLRLLSVISSIYFSQYIKSCTYVLLSYFCLVAVRNDKMRCSINRSLWTRSKTHNQGHSLFELSQWERTLYCNVVFPWLSPYQEWSMCTQFALCYVVGNWYRLTAVFYRGICTG